MRYLNENKEDPPRSLTVNGIQYPVARMIERGDTTGLAALGIYPCAEDTVPAPLGYTDWTLVDNQWVREPNGTEQERALAINQQKWSVASAQRQRKQAQATLAADPSTTTAAERAAALEILTGAL